jgi:hypothetical protein
MKCLFCRDDETPETRQEISLSWQFSFYKTPIDFSIWIKHILFTQDISTSYGSNVLKSNQHIIYIYDSNPTMKYCNLYKDVQRQNTNNNDNMIINYIVFQFQLW